MSGLAGLVLDLRLISYRFAAHILPLAQTFAKSPVGLTMPLNGLGDFLRLGIKPAYPLTPDFQSGTL